eukprot:TRINITY_DN848_c0_g1_i1.p1 TRINITY_DN848_c0_g1~~TRINITY_DN848_c0_g1_i1.p1  ORF type:complete len:552 (+),score=140.02 TRINITY_DN848_c0_g1_i1:45-1700(+)
MYIKSIVLSVILALGLVSAQLPFNNFGSATVQPKAWSYFPFNVEGLREGDMLIADVSDTTNTDIQLFAQFDRNPLSGDSWSFTYNENINNGAFERIFAVVFNGELVSTPQNASEIVFGVFNNHDTIAASISYHFYSKSLIDVTIGETRIVHLEEGQYQFFRYEINEAMATAGNYLLRIETVAVNGDVISFRSREQFPIGIPSIGFTYGIPAVDEPGLSYIGLSSDLQVGPEYAGVANLDPPGDLEDESTDVAMSFNYAQSYNIPASPDSMFEQTFTLLPNSWLYLTVPVGGANTVLVVETITPGPLMLPLIRNGGFPSALYHDGWNQRTILRRLASDETLQFTFKAVSEPVTAANTVVGYLNTDTVQIYANVLAHYALVRDVRLGDSFDNEFLNRSGMWRFYRFQSTESDENALLSINITPSAGHSDVFYFIGGFPTTEQFLPWLTQQTVDGSSARTMTVGLTLNTIYTIGVLASDQLQPSTYSISFNRASRPEAVNNNVSTALVIVVVILGCTTVVGIIAVIVLAVQRKKEHAALAAGEGPNYAKLVDTD